MAYASRISKGSCRCTACIAWSSAMLVPSMRATRRCHGVFWLFLSKALQVFFTSCELHPFLLDLNSKKTYGLWKMHFDALTPWLCMQFCESQVLLRLELYSLLSSYSCRLWSFFVSKYFDMQIVFQVWLVSWHYWPPLCWSRGWCLDRILFLWDPVSFFSCFL